jgi:hypothetical protein
MMYRVPPEMTTPPLPTPSFSLSPTKQLENNDILHCQENPTIITKRLCRDWAVLIFEVFCVSRYTKDLNLETRSQPFGIPVSVHKKSFRMLLGTCFRYYKFQPIVFLVLSIF